jgi:hypothetical protein
MSDITMLSGETTSVQNDPGQMVSISTANGPSNEQTTREATRTFEASNGDRFEVVFRVTRTGIHTGDIVPFDVPLRITLERTDDE